jgi:hypothetical protein
MRLWSLSVLAVAALVSVLLPAGAIVSVRAASQQSEAPLSVTDCTTSQLSDIIASYTGTPAPHATSVPLPANARSYLAYILRKRLAVCAAMLSGYNGPTAGPGSPAGACSPASNENDVRVLWKHLQLCVALVNPPVAVSPIIKWKLPPTSNADHRRVIFVIGAGGDPAMLGKLISSLTVYLDQTGYYFAGDSVLIPEPAWSPDVYAAQCEQSPQVEGAIVLQITAAGSGATDQFVSRKNWSAIEATALYAQCQRDRSASTGVPAYVWVSNMAKAENHYITITPLTPLALLLTLGAAYEEFAPARTTSTQTTRIFSNPATPTPPPGGRVTQIQTTNAQTLNAASLGAVAAGFLASAITYTNATAPLTQPPTVDQETWDTLQDVAYELVKEMNCWQPPPEAIGSLRVTDVVGHPRNLPSYNPPPGLGRYSTGEPSAPFCAEPNPTPTPESATGGGESIRDLLPPSAAPTDHRWRQAR